MSLYPFFVSLIRQSPTIPSYCGVHFLMLLVTSCENGGFNSHIFKPCMTFRKFCITCKVLISNFRRSLYVSAFAYPMWIFGNKLKECRLLKNCLTSYVPYTMEGCAFGEEISVSTTFAHLSRADMSFDLICSICGIRPSI